MVPAGGGVVPDESGPERAVGRDGAGEADELGDGGGVLAGGLEEVLDLKDVAGDLKVAVAVHGVRWFLGMGGARAGESRGASAAVERREPRGAGKPEKRGGLDQSWSTTASTAVTAGTATASLDSATEPTDVGDVHRCDR